MGEGEAGSLRNPRSPGACSLCCELQQLTRHHLVSGQSQQRRTGGNGSPVSCSASPIYPAALGGLLRGLPPKTKGRPVEVTGPSPPAKTSHGGQGFSQLGLVLKTEEKAMQPREKTPGTGVAGF